ncbi:hypothetical protein NC651_033885 [Populus alba x Populus x berolinensis]|nr:hypothetical protein NC651_033885 [Populus alba x Populus x berolinensis]
MEKRFFSTVEVMWKLWLVSKLIWIDRVELWWHLQETHLSMLCAGLTLRLLRYDKRLKTKTESFRHRAWEAQSGGHKILLSVRWWIPSISYLRRQTCSVGFLTFDMRLPTRL